MKRFLYLPFLALFLLLACQNQGSRNAYGAIIPDFENDQVDRLIVEQNLLHLKFIEATEQGENVPMAFALLQSRHTQVNDKILTLVDQPDSQDEFYKYADYLRTLSDGMIARYKEATQ